MTGLSPQEQRVLAFATQGFSDKEIALELEVSFDTVRTYWGRIKMKAGTSNRTESVAYFVRLNSEAESKATEGQLRELKDLLHQREADDHLVRSILGALPIGAFLRSRDGSLVYVNAEWENIADVDSPLALHLGWLGGVHADDRALTDQVVSDALRNGIPYRVEFRHIGSVGSLRVLVERAEPLKRQSEDLQFVGILEDVTELRKQEVKAREFVDHLVLAEKIGGLGSYVFHWSDGSSVWSPGLYDLLELQPELGPLNTEQFLKSVHPEDRARVEATIGNCKDAGDSVVLKYRFRTMSGRELYLQVTSACQDSRDGGKVTIGTVRDISEVAHLQTQISDLRARTGRE